jgi:Rne/Rng family ribonuclease
MPKELVISAAPHETRVAILEDGLLCEIYIEREKEFALVGSIYKGRVTRVLPGMQSAFVDIGLDSDAFLYVGDFLENLEDYDHVVAPVEGKIEKMEQQGGAVFAPPAASPVEAPAEPVSAPEPGNEALPLAPVSEGGVSPQPPRHFTPAPRPFQRQDRGPGGPGGGYGHDRGGGGGGRRRGGGGGGGGRWRRGGGGGDRRPGPGRDLPPSKYASPRPFTPRPYQPAEEPPPPSDYTPVILPGESLAKYKDRVPGAPASAKSLTESSSAPASEQTTASGLPSSLYATNQEPSAADNADMPEAHAESVEAAAPPEPLTELSAVAAAEPEMPLAHELEAAEEHTREHSKEHAERPHHAEVLGASGMADLSEDEATALAEQLAEARHEEAAAEAEADEQVGTLDEELPPAPETAAETEAFAAESEAQDRLEQQEQDRHEPDLTPSELDDEERIDALALEAAEAMAGPAHEHENEHETGAGEHEPSAPSDAQPDIQPESQPMSARISQPQRARFQRPMRRGGRPQRSGGGRPMRQQDHRQQAARRPQLISEMLKAGQEIIVQIAKEPLGKKGARITSHVALPGRFLVYMPTVNHIGVSRRIASADERSRLRRLVGEAKGAFPGGFIVRTAAEGAPEDEIRADVEFLGRTWEKTLAQGEPRKAPSLLHRDLNLVERILRDYVSNDYTAIWIDNEEEFGKVVEFVSRFQPKLVGRVKLYTKAAPIFEEFGIQQELDKALRPKVWLKSGGYIVINHTEALVAIDVNTGKYVGRGSTRLEDTIVKTNLEAVKEIVRQIRLRDLGGIIVLDLIDMEERRNREKVMIALEQSLRTDRAPSKVLGFNEFGLVTVTRKRTKQALERVLCQPCPYCTGSGMVKSIPTICYEIQAEARKMSADLESTSLTLRVHPEIAKALKTREAGLIEELEQLTRKSAIIQADPTLHWEQYDIY